MNFIRKLKSAIQRAVGLNRISFVVIVLGIYFLGGSVIAAILRMINLAHALIFIVAFSTFLGSGLYLKSKVKGTGSELELMLEMGSFKMILVQFIAILKSRLNVIILYTWPAISSLIIASNKLPTIIELLKLFLSITFVGYSVYLYNDIMDLNNDLKNKEFGNPVPANRPLGSGKIRLKLFKKFTIFLASIGLLVASLINIYIFTLQLINILLGILYSTEPIRLKKRFLAKQMTIIISVILSILSGALTVGIFNINILYLILINSSLIITNTILLDISDLRGDMITGIKTIPAVLGPHLSIKITILINIFIIISSLIGYLKLEFNILLPIIIIPVILTYIHDLYRVLNKWMDPIFITNVIYKKLIPISILMQLSIILGKIKI